jgi:hypothetical protein
LRFDFYLQNYAIIAQSELLQILDRDVLYVLYTRGRRISGFCGGLGRDQETTGGKLRAAGRVRIVGKNFFSFVSDCVGVPEMVFSILRSQKLKIVFFFLLKNGI